VAILLAGFLLGGIVLSPRKDNRSRGISRTGTPNVPRQILKRAGLFEIVVLFSPVVEYLYTKVVKREPELFFEDPFFDFGLFIFSLPKMERTQPRVWCYFSDAYYHKQPWKVG
jgi:hypothetical protein